MTDRTYTRNYARGTFVVMYTGPFGGYAGANVMCSDGVVRRVTRISLTADTLFSVPAAVRVNGKTVSGYLTVETLEGFTTDTVADPAVVKFVAYNYGKNAAMLPKGAYRTSDLSMYVPLPQGG